MKPIKFHPLAGRELEESVVFYNERAAGLGNEFFLLIVEATSQIQARPLRWPPHRLNTRRMRLGRFPFSLIYRDDPTRILIVAVAHRKRHPDYWIGRVN